MQREHENFGGLRKQARDHRLGSAAPPLALPRLRFGAGVAYGVPGPRVGRCTSSYVKSPAKLALRALCSLHRARAMLRALASLIAFLFAAILVWRMSDGMLDQREYNYATTILQLPIWLAYLPILLSLALLVAASLVTLTESLRATQGGRNG